MSVDVFYSDLLLVTTVTVTVLKEEQAFSSN